MPRCRCHGRETTRRSASAPKASTPWLPQPEGWSTLTVEAQRDDPASTLNLYREALRLRRELPELGDGPLEWWDDASVGANHVLAFRRGPDSRAS
jgi:alpha-glucosidase